MPDYTEAWIDLGNTLFVLCRYTEAVASYDMALVIHPDNIDAWKNGGFALYNFKRYPDGGCLV